MLTPILKHPKHWFREYRQVALHLTHHCSFRCYDCRWWQTDPPPLSDINCDYISLHIQPGTIVNLIGGDPACHPLFRPILTTLTTMNCPIRLWSTCAGSLDDWANILPLINQLNLYVPSGDPDQYQHINGTSSWDHLQTTLTAFKEFPTNIRLNYEVRPDTIQYLPDLYQFAQDNHVFCLIHCNPKHFHDPATLLFIKRFYGIRNAWVFFTHAPLSQGRCSGVPNELIYDRWQRFKNTCHEGINRIRRQFKL